MYCHLEKPSRRWYANIPSSLVYSTNFLIFNRGADIALHLFLPRYSPPYRVSSFQSVYACIIYMSTPLHVSICLCVRLLFNSDFIHSTLSVRDSSHHRISKYCSIRAYIYFQCRSLSTFRSVHASDLSPNRASTILFTPPIRVPPLDITAYPRCHPSACAWLPASILAPPRHPLCLCVYRFCTFHPIHGCSITTCPRVSTPRSVFMIYRNYIHWCDFMRVTW